MLVIYKKILKFKFKGGLIYSELLICLFDVFFELILWIIDPYSIIHYFRLRSQISKGKECVLTQQEGNL